MTAPYLGSVAMRMTLALPVQLFSIDCWYSETTDGAGSQTRATPAGCSTSTRVVISNVRQVPGRGVNSFCWARAIEARPGSCEAATAAGTAADTLRNMRRFI